MSPKINREINESRIGPENPAFHGKMHLQIFGFEQRVRAMSGFKMKLRRSAIFVAANCKNDKAPSGAAYSGNDFERSLLTELGNLSGVSSTKISLLAELAASALDFRQQLFVLLWLQVHANTILFRLSLPAKVF